MLIFQGVPLKVSGTWLQIQIFSLFTLSCQEQTAMLPTTEMFQERM